MGKRQHSQGEWRLLSWWLATFHSGAEIWMNQRLGPTQLSSQSLPLDEFDVNAARLRNRWADAIYLENNQLNLVEAKLEPDPGIFSTIVHYARKLRADPFFAQYANLPLNLIALVMRDDPSVGEEAPFYGVQWIVWAPDWATFEQTTSKGNNVLGTPSELPADFPARVSLLKTSNSNQNAT
jgi:hypothetical protein